MNIIKIKKIVKERFNFGKYLHEVKTKDLMLKMVSEFERVFIELKKEKMFLDFDVYEKDLNIFATFEDFDHSKRNFSFKFINGNVSVVDDDNTDKKIIYEFSKLKKGWNGNDGEPIPEDAVKIACEIIDYLPEGVGYFPTGRESINFEFEQNGIDIELEVFKNKAKVLIDKDDKMEEYEVYPRSDSCLEYVNDIIDSIKCNLDRIKSKKFTDFHTAWHYLNNCSVFKEIKNALIDAHGGSALCTIVLEYSSFFESLDINVVKVNPENNRIDTNERLNTKTQVWLECGEPYYERQQASVYYNSHNPDYDCGADTFESAVIILANKVFEKNREDYEN